MKINILLNIKTVSAINIILRQNPVVFLKGIVIILNGSYSPNTIVLLKPVFDKKFVKFFKFPQLFL